MKKLLIIMALACTATAGATRRQEISLCGQWQFSRDGQTWQTVDVPHDWAIAGPFDKKWDLQVVAIEQNGERQATEKSGRSGALPWIGEGHYRRHFNIPRGFKGEAMLVFDGAMAEPVVSVNHQEAGRWAYGYNTFRMKITDLIRKGDNLIEVDLKNVEESSRWYPGAGIYRPVKLVLTGQDWIDPWHTFVRTTSIAGGRATVQVTAAAGSPLDVGLSFETLLYDADGRLVARQTSSDINNAGEAEMTLTVDNPRLWTPETPHLYKACIRYMQDGETLDEIVQKVGIRTVSVSKEGGFQLNGTTRKIKGVCLHHDLGPLGAAVNRAALIRQIKTMKDMGCDAIRTAHNMPSQMQMDLCDSLGMMVMAESFDMWLYPKCKNGYARFFDEWSYQDIENLVLANRNHPSVVMWSIGNEIPEQGGQKGVELATYLQDLCHSLDDTRPVTQGLDRVDAALKSGVAQMMDVPGFNYRVHKYQKGLDTLPQGFLLGSETASTVSSRGVYYFPVVPTDNGVHADGQCTGYDVEWCSWSNLPDDDFRWQDDCPQVIGQFVWTGYDYLGEPTPYDEYWPSRSSYFGICDLAGLPKDRYWLYRSQWNRQQHTVHLLPHWTWGPEREGQVTPVYCYTDCPEAELFVNGKSQGRIRKNPSERLDRYRLRWNDVVYQPGEISVTVYDETGKNCGSASMKSAKSASRLSLDVWTQHEGPVLSADGDDLAFVTVSLTDDDGTLVPHADDQLQFSVEGAGTFRAVCNGDATSLESFAQPTMRLFRGQLVVVVQAAKKKGRLRLTVTDPARNLSQHTDITVR